MREAASIGPYWMPRPQKPGKIGIWNKPCTAALQDSVAVPWGALSCRKLSQQGEHLLKNHQQHWNLWSLQGGCANCNTPVQAPGSNPTVSSTNTEPHRSYSSLVAAQTSACLSRMPEFPGASRHSLQQPLSLPVPAQPSPAPCSHLILFPA